MRFTEELSRKRFASKVVHSLIPPQNVFDLAKVLSSRMRLRSEGRMWMAAHMRRGDCKYPCCTRTQAKQVLTLSVQFQQKKTVARLGWVMEKDPEAHIKRVKDRLQAGRTVLVDLHERGDWTTMWDVENVEADPDQATLPPPQAGDPFFVATDERDPEVLRKFAAAGAVFMSDLLTMEDRRTYGWPLLFTDLEALFEQELLVHSDYFYGHCMSSFSGVIMNLRAGRGADLRTMLLD
jgi:hypothetical protein